MAETWRVVPSGGSAREVRVRAGHSMMEGLAFFASIDAAPAVLGSTPRLAVLRLCAQRGIDAEQILAPGVSSRAEAIEAARREGAEAMRGRCIAAAAWDDDGFDGCHAPDVQEIIEAAIRALPLDAPTERL